jgi:diacylglycerol kinase
MNAFGYSLEGFKAAFKHEDAFRQEVFLAIVLIPLALYLEPESCAPCVDDRQCLVSD